MRSHVTRDAARALLLIVTVAVSIAGCASSRAQILEDQPTLVVPPVPPRSIEPQPTAELPQVETVVDFPPAPSTTTNKPTPRAANRPPEPKQEPKPEAPPDTAVPAVPNPPPVAPLRTATTPSGPEAARQIRETLDRVSTTLSTRIDFQKLSDDGKANYNSAKAWIEQAAEALKKDDLSLAKNLAERAENIARQLSGR
jgi:hypothetical protein